MGLTGDGTMFDWHGPGDAQVVVLIHGLGLNRACWQWTVPALARKYRVLRYDLHGHGDSAPPSSRPDLTLFRMQLANLLDHTSVERAAIVGFSLGGMIARRFAQDHPERTVALGLLHTPHLRTPEAQTAVADRADQARTLGPSATVEAALQRWFTDAFRSQNPAIMGLVRNWVMANDPTIYHTIYRVLTDGVAEVCGPNPPLTCPALVMTGDQDDGNAPAMARAIAAEIAGARVHILRGLRHMALAEDPGAVNAPLTAFLDEVHNG